MGMFSSHSMLIAEAEGGPSSFSLPIIANGDDGYSVTGVSWGSTTADLVGLSAGGLNYNIGLWWDNCPAPKGTIVTPGTGKLTMNWKAVNGTSPVGDIYIDVDYFSDPVRFTNVGGNRPEDMSKSTAVKRATVSSIGVATYDIDALLNEVFALPAYAANKPLRIAIVEPGAAANAKGDFITAKPKDDGYAAIIEAAW